MLKLFLVILSLTCLFSCELGQEDSSSPFGSSDQVTCCYTSTKATESTGNDTDMLSIESSCSLSTATFQRGSCSTTGKMEGYCKVAEKRKIFYWSSGYTLGEAQLKVA